MVTNAINISSLVTMKNSGMVTIMATTFLCVVDQYYNGYFLLLEKHIERSIFASKTLHIRKGVFLLLCFIVSVASENFQMADCV